MLLIKVFRVYIVRTTFTTLIDRFTSVYPSTLGYEVTNWQLSCQLIKFAHSNAINNVKEPLHVRQLTRLSVWP